MKGGTEPIEHGVVDLPLDREAIAESRLFDAQVAAQIRDLVAERRQLTVALRERRPEQLAQLGQHRDRAVVLTLKHRRPDHVQRVEEEVRLQLRSERRQLRAGQLRLQPQRLVFLGPQQCRRVDRVRGRDDRRIEQQLEMQIRDDEEDRGQRERTIHASEEARDDRQPNHRVVGEVVKRQDSNRHRRRGAEMAHE